MPISSEKIKAIFLLVSLFCFLSLPPSLWAQTIQPPSLRPGDTPPSLNHVPAHLLPVEGQQFAFNEQESFPEDGKHALRREARSKRPWYEQWRAGPIILTLVIAAVVIASDGDDHKDSGRSLRSSDKFFR